MKIKDGFILRQVADSYIVVAVGDSVKEFNGIINLNETGAFIWGLFQKEASEEQVVSALLKEYDVDAETARKDVKIFVDKLKDKNLIK